MIRLTFLLLLSAFWVFCHHLSAQTYEQVMLSVPPDSSGFEATYYGNSVSLFGNIVMVGARRESYDENEQDSLKYAGAVYVLQPDPARRWLPVQKLVAPQRQIAAVFGASVDLDGNRAIISHRGFKISPFHEFQGIAHIFERTVTGNWIASDTLIGSQRSDDDNFGDRVAINNQRALVSDHTKPYRWGVGPDDFTVANGAAHLFEQDSSGDWHEAALLLVPDTTDYNWFGKALDLEGDYAVIGALWEDEDETNLNTRLDAGAAYVFHRDSLGQWNLLQKLVPPDRHEFQEFGNEVVIDNQQIFVGALGANVQDSAGNITYLSTTLSAYSNRY
ncbi:MAG: FG-GAP repeat protein [Bacteroidota bacterium]